MPWRKWLCESNAGGKGRKLQLRSNALNVHCPLSYTVLYIILYYIYVVYYKWKSIQCINWYMGSCFWMDTDSIRKAFGDRLTWKSLKAGKSPTFATSKAIIPLERNFVEIIKPIKLCKQLYWLWRSEGYDHRKYENINICMLFRTDWMKWRLNDNYFSRKNGGIWR